MPHGVSMPYNTIHVFKCNDFKTYLLLLVLLFFIIRTNIIIIDNLHIETEL